MKQDLLDIYIELYDTAQINGQNLSDLAQRLSRISGRVKPWSGDYLRILLKGYKGYTFTDDLIAAIQQLGAMLDGQTTLQATLRPVSVLGRNGDVTDGAVICGREQGCALPSCRVRFVRSSPRQICCCTEHTRALRELRRHNEL